jgi:hypothetical protein
MSSASAECWLVVKCVATRTSVGHGATARERFEESVARFQATSRMFEAVHDGIKSSTRRILSHQPFPPAVMTKKF